jgi:PKD repeat protein
MKNFTFKTRLSLLLAAMTLSAGTLSAQNKVQPCGTTEYTRDVSMKDPDFLKNQAILEAQTIEYINNKNAHKGAAADDVKIIPIVFHVIHNYGAENVSKESILEQVAVLNEDFRRMNADTNKTNPLFKGIAADTKIEFRLAQIDPNGNCTDGIVRVPSILTYDAGNDVKALSYWPNNKYFNVWVVQTITNAQPGSIVLGRSQFPGGSNLTDGVLLRSEVCGRTTNYQNYGRTLTHEIGHSLNLRHIWGDANCGNDQVNDTPIHQDANDGCPVNKTNTCLGTVTYEMVENYMDYTNGNCQNMFSEGQNDRMQAVMNGTTNGRNNLWKEANLIATGTNEGYVPVACVPKADFYSNTLVCINTNVSYKDMSWRGTPTAWSWEFEGGTPAVSTDQNPVVTYDVPGVYRVKFKVSNATGEDSLVKDSYVTVMQNPSTVNALQYTEGMEDANLVGKNVFVFSDDNLAWEQTTNAAYSGNSSIYIKLFGSAAGKTDAFVLPMLDLTGVSAPTLKFRVAHAQRASSFADKLTVSVSKNCGITFISKYSKSGATLATTGNSVSSFVPNNASQWREESVSLVNIQNSNSGLIRFEATSASGNNIYIDDISITGTFTTGVDQFIANNLNFTVYPNPVVDQAQVKFFLAEGADVSLKVYDLLGREISTIMQEKLSLGEHTYELNTGKAGISKAGIYLVKLRVNGFEKVSKVMISE